MGINLTRVNIKPGSGGLGAETLELDNDINLTYVNIRPRSTSQGVETRVYLSSPVILII